MRAIVDYANGPATLMSGSKTISLQIYPACGLSGREIAALILRLYPPDASLSRRRWVRAHAEAANLSLLVAKAVSATSRIGRSASRPKTEQAAQQVGLL
jgi:hypothetical protein